MDRRDRRGARQSNRPLCDIRGIVCDTLQIGRDFEGRHDVPQIQRHRLAQREQPGRLNIDFVIQFVDEFVIGDNLRRKIRIPFDHAFDGPGDLVFGQTAHLDDVVVQLGELFVIGFDDVVAGLRVRSHLSMSPV